MTSRRNICDFLVCDNDRVANDGGDRTWIVRLDRIDPGVRLAVKDCIDVQGLPTTVGCPVIAEQARPEARDAAVVAAARRSGARIVGKTNLAELCWSAAGTNDWSGMPVNPVAPSRRVSPGHHRPRIAAA
jgi:hypothetical protein